MESQGLSAYAVDMAALGEVLSEHSFYADAAIFLLLRVPRQRQLLVVVRDCD
jgi:hypothetical protein